MAERDDETGLPLPPKPAAAPEPHVHPPMPPSFAPGGPPSHPPFSGFPGSPDGSSVPMGPWPEESRHPRPSPSSAGLRAMGIAVVAFLVFAFGAAAFLLLKPTPPHAAQVVPAPEQAIELPPGQRLIHAEIGQGGEVYYRYAPLQPGEQPRNSTVEGRWSDGSSVGKIHFIERVAE